MNRRYPETRTEPVLDALAGVQFADPYRWLEASDEEVRSWQQAQGELACAHVREWGDFERLRGLVAHFSTERYVSLPRFAAGYWFRIRAAEGLVRPDVVVSARPLGEGRVLFDPSAQNNQNRAFLSWIAPSPDGRTLALGLCEDGSENNTIRLVDVGSGQLLADAPSQTLMDNWTGGVQWLKDSSGFFFTGIVGAAAEFEQVAYLHRRGAVPTTVALDIPWTAHHDYRMVLLSTDGRHAVAIERLQNPIPVAVAALGAAGLNWRSFVTSCPGTVAGQAVGDRYIAITDVGAPRGRVVSIKLDAEDADDEESWQELVAESSATLRTLTTVGEFLYLTELSDSYARVRIVDFKGNPVGVVPLPGPGALGELPFPMMNLVPRGHPEKYLFAFSSLTVAPGIYCHPTAQAQSVETLRPAQVRLEDALVEHHWALSTDGTRVPYHLVRRADVSPDRPQPTLIYGYGGYNVALVPRFPGPMAAFVAAGGVFIHAHLRGGGEFGLDWWQSGRMSHKQNGYDDLYAIAEHLIGTGRSTPRMLALTGGSNGGLLAGVALTQRPELWAAVVPRVPVLDLIGACREPYGRQAIMEEMADVESAADVRRLSTFSPYHLIRRHVAYPAVFLDAGDTDPRCPAWHARKFAARLQAATSGDAPILLRVWGNVGHGWATEQSVAVMEHTEWLAFTLRHLGVERLPAGIEDYGS